VLSEVIFHSSAFQVMDRLEDGTEYLRRQTTYDVTSRGVRVTIGVAEKQ
jgi:hypothetical protein